MGIIRCNIHGRQGFAEVCTHVDAALTAGCIVHRELLNDVEACDACIDALDLRRFPGRSWDDDDEGVCRWADDREAVRCYEILSSESSCWCSECINAVELAAARKAGNPEPFTAFESTLTYQQEQTVDRLRCELGNAFQFRQSIGRTETTSMRVAAGALTYPLAITIYYVVAPEEQQVIVDWLDAFFAGIERNQYQVEFFRAQNWSNSEERPNFWDRGPEELLRKHLANPPTPRP